METKNQKLIVVLGMHRSGTSAITRGLQVLGVELGEKLMPAVASANAKGYWEDIDLYTLDKEILEALKSDWNRLAPIEPCDIDVLRKQGYHLRAVELLRHKIDSKVVFGLKDPRLAKLLPFWKEVFSHGQLNVSYVLAIRHPLSVAKSLLKRDRMLAEESYLLWLGHVISSLVSSAGSKRVLVDYDRLMLSPDSELMRVSQCLGLGIDPAEMQRYKTQFLDQELRHTVYELNDLLLDSACPPMVCEVYAALLDVASDKIALSDKELLEKVESWKEEFERIKSPLLLADRLQRQRSEAMGIVTERDGRIVSLNQAVAERDGRIVSLNQAVAERDGRIVSLNQAVAERDSQVVSFNQVVADLEDQIVSLSQTVAERDGQIVSLNQAVAERDGQLASLEQTIDERNREIENYSAERRKLVESICLTFKTDEM